MPNRENLKTAFEIVLAWIMIFGVALAIPDQSLSFDVKILIGCISAVGLTIYSAYYFLQKTDTESDFYSPIHAMIVKVNNEVPSEQALRMTVGAWMDVKLLGIDHQSVSETFTQNATKFKDEDLKTWAIIEGQINASVNGNGFYMGHDVQEWFDDLEARYNRKS